jgi:predicted small metal-binding protein
MDKMISCRDFGSECTFTACAETETELFEKVLEHTGQFTA